MRKLSQQFIPFIFLLFLNSLGFSQDKSSTKQEHILIAIEDSLRGKFMFGKDSAWLNGQLQFYNEPFKESKIKYKLVKIGKRKFTEGPHAKAFEIQKPINFKYGDSFIHILGEKFYTYIGNSSWGYYPEYKLQRIYPVSTLKFKPRDPNTCEHGWDMRRGQACYQCLDNYRMKNDSNYKRAHSLKLNKIDPYRYCKHGFDTYSSLHCIDCKLEEKMKKDSTYGVIDSTKKIRIKPQIMNCAHGHICCQVQCPCCPKKQQILIQTQKK